MPASSSLSSVFWYCWESSCIRPSAPVQMQVSSLNHSVNLLMMTYCPDKRCYIGVLGYPCEMSSRGLDGLGKLFFRRRRRSRCRPPVANPDLANPAFTKKNRPISLLPHKLLTDRVSRRTILFVDTCPKTRYVAQNVITGSACKDKY